MASKANKRRRKRTVRGVLGSARTVKSRPAPGTRIYRSGDRIQTSRGTWKNGKQILDGEGNAVGVSPIQPAQKLSTPVIAPPKPLTPEEQAVANKVAKRKAVNEYHGLDLIDPRRKELGNQIRRGKAAPIQPQPVVGQPVVPQPVIPKPVQPQVGQIASPQDNLLQTDPLKSPLDKPLPPYVNPGETAVPSQIGTGFDQAQVEMQPPPLPPANETEEQRQKRIINKYQEMNTPEHRQALQDKVDAGKAQRAAARQNAIKLVSEQLSRTTDPETRARRQEQLNQLTGTRELTPQEQIQQEITTAIESGDKATLVKHSLTGKLTDDQQRIAERAITAIDTREINSHNKKAATLEKNMEMRAKAHGVKEAIMGRLDELTDERTRKRLEKLAEKAFNFKNTDPISKMQQASAEIKALEEAITRAEAKQKRREDQAIAEEKMARTSTKDDEAKAKTARVEEKSIRAEKKADAVQMYKFAKDDLKEAERKLKSLKEGDNEPTKKEKADAIEEVEAARKAVNEARIAAKAAYSTETTQAEQSPAEGFFPEMRPSMSSLSSKGFTGFDSNAETVVKSEADVAKLKSGDVFYIIENGVKIRKVKP